MTVTPERMIRVVKFCSTLNGCWPLPPNASKETVRRREMWWIFSMVFSVHAIVQCYQGIARKPENSVKITKTITEVSSVVLAFFKMSICKYHRESLKVTHTCINKGRRKISNAGLRIHCFTFSASCTPHSILFLSKISSTRCTV